VGGLADHLTGDGGVTEMLTDLKIKNEGKGSSRREIPDGKIAGLYLVIQTTGAKSWAVRYRVDGKPKKLTIGPYPAIDLAVARRKAQEALGEVAGGSDPSATKIAAREVRKAAESTADRVAEVSETFITRYVKRNAGGSWARESERLLRKEVIPALGKKRLGEVKKSEVHAMLDAIVDRGAPIVANRALAIFRRLCNWAIERGIISLSPCDKIKAPAIEESRDRVLTDDEIRRAWGAFESIGWPFGPIAKLLLLTGARRDEIGSATWGEIDLAAKTWTIVKERSKNGAAHEIPLSDGAVAIFKGLPKIAPKRDDNGKLFSSFIFTTTGMTAVSGFSKAKEDIDAAMLAALRAEAEKGADVESPARWTFHDLRRTAASGMARLGIPPHVVEAVLNHKSGMIKGVAAVYNRYSYATEKRQALDAWARRLNSIASPARTMSVVEAVSAVQP
jgi:integrase